MTAREGLLAAVVLAAVVGCCGAGGANSALLALCGQRANTLHTALLLYSTDFDDKFPPGPVWMDGIEPYLSAQTSNFHCPALAGDEYGYALHEVLAGNSWTDIIDPSLISTVMETTDLARNAVSTEADLPSDPRHGGRNVRMLLDGTLVTEAP
jgi:hypothetical protein